MWGRRGGWSGRAALGQGTEALSIALIFDGASSGSTRAQWVELAPFLEIVAWCLGSEPCRPLGANGDWPRVVMAPGQVLGTKHRGTEGRFWQRGMLSRGFCCLGIGYWHSATFVFFPSTNIHYIWLGWTRGAHLHVRNSIEGLE